MLCAADPGGWWLEYLVFRGLWTAAWFARELGRDLLPIASRIRSRLRLEALAPKELRECFNHLCAAAGNSKLMTDALVHTLCEHAAGNLRLLMNMANELLLAASRQEREQIDEALYFETFALDPKPARARTSARQP